MNRRRILLSYLANSFSWELYSKVYFYNELVPTTINGKNVLNKAKIVKVSGNGVIENQLVQNGNFEDTSNFSGTNGTLSASNNVLSYTITAIGGDYGSNRLQQTYTNLANHYYLIDIWVKTPYATMVRCYIDNFVDLGTTVANQWTRLTKLYKPTSSSGTNNIYFDVHGQASYQVGDVIQVRQYQKKDLTLREGTGNEPTTLTDNRIQNILNRGYIAYNLGEYKESDIGEFSTTKADTTTLDTITFKAQLGGAINSHNTMEITNSAYVFTRNVWKYTFNGSETWSLYSTSFFYVTLSNLPPTSDGTYPLSTNGIVTRGNSATYANVRAYIEDNPQLSTSSNMNTIYSSGTKIIYPLATPQVITIPRKHLGIVDLGSLNWGYDGETGRFYSRSIQFKGVGYREIANAYCSKFITASTYNLNNLTYNNSISLADDNNLIKAYIKEIGTNPTDFKNAMSGVLLFYETQDEVADITDTIDIESGGTITTDSEVLPNIELSVKCK